MPHARAAFDELKQGIRKIDFLSDRNSGEVRFGCPEGLAPLLPPIIESFSAGFPGIILDIYEEEFASFAAKLRDLKLDFVLQRLHGHPRNDDPAFDDLHAELLFDDEVVVVAGLQSQWARRRKVALADLLDEAWILTGPPSWNHSVVVEACQSRGLRLPAIVLSTFSTHIRATMVASGRFVATFPKSVARVYAERFAMKILPVELPRRPWPVAILTLKERSLSPAVELFIKHVREYMRGSKSVSPMRARTHELRKQS
jgi:DNA-binding transcriptional LysR family regulator